MRLVPPVHLSSKGVRTSTADTPSRSAHHPGGNPGANLKSISHRCQPILVAFEFKLTKETNQFAHGLPTGRSDVDWVAAQGETTVPDELLALKLPQILSSRFEYSHS